MLLCPIAGDATAFVRAVKFVFAYFRQRATACSYGGQWRDWNRAVLDDLVSLGGELDAAPH